MQWMNDGMGEGTAELLGMGEFGLFALAPLVIWSLAWKGWALWLAARRGELVWFIVLLIINTVGILEIIYIFAVAKRQDRKPAREETDVQEPPSMPLRPDQI